MSFTARALPALLACALAPTVHAQTSPATLYGTIDVSVRHASGLNEFAPASGSTSSVTSGVDNTSVFGVRGSEDLGNGLKAVFQLESGINVDTGANATASKFWDRQAWVGLQVGWATLTLGRQRALLGDSVSPVDPLGMRLAGFNPNINVASLSQHRLGADYGSAGSTTGSYRLDNAAKVVARFGSLTLRAMASAGEDVSGRSTGVAATWDASGLTLSGAYTQFRTLAERKLDAWVLGGGYRIGAARVTLTLGESDAETSPAASTDNRTIGVGLSLPVAPGFELITAYYKVERERTGRADDGFGRAVAFLEYALSKRTRLYAELDATRWKDGYQGPGNKADATGLSLGMVHNF